MKAIVSVVIVFFITQAFAVQRADAYDIKVKYSVSLSDVNLRLDSSAIPASVSNEAQNPHIHNPYTGNDFDKAVIGTFDPADNAFPGASVSFNVTASATDGNTPFLRLKLPFALGDTIHGNFSHGYAYSKQLGQGGDWVLYIYGAKVKYDLFAPEIGYHWQKRKNSFDVGLELRTSHIKFFKGLEAFGKPQDLELLGESDATFYLLNAQYQFSNNHWSIGLTFPLSGGKGVGLIGGYQF